MKWLLNTHDPKDKNAPMYVDCSFHETQEQAWANHLEWLKGKTIGDPQASETYTVEQLKEMGMVGVYAQQQRALDASPLARLKKFVGLGSRQ